jgi:hypothetical protein
VTRGIIYPPLNADGYLGGTRYMPLPVLLDAASMKLIGEVLVSAKLATYLVAAALCAIALVVMRQVGCRTPLALALVAVVVVTPTGLVGTLGLRNDGLAVVLQLAAVACVLRSQTRASVIAAGAFSALAIFAKVSAVWAVIAIGIWLVAFVRPRLPAFLAAFGAFALSAGLVVELSSGGRFHTNLTEFTLAGNRGIFAPVTQGLQSVITNLATQADAAWLLFPLAAVAIFRGLRARAPTLLQLTLIVELIVLSVVMSSRGTDHNHLLDLCVLTVLVVGEFAADQFREERLGLVALVITAAVVWGVGSSYQRTMGPQTLGALRQIVRGDPDGSLEPNPLAGFVRRTDRLLSEDPTIPLLLGQRPVLLDSFVARRALAKHPSWAQAWARRVSARNFDKIILVAGLEPGTGLFDQQFLGRAVNDAVLANYRLAYAELDLYVYVPVTPARGA